MDKREFLENLIERVRMLPIEDIIATRINLVKKGSNYFSLCPFHNDRRMGSFVISPNKNIFKCFSCGTGGDAIKFIALYDGISYVESAFKIGLEFGIITYSEYDEFFNKRRYTKKEILKIENIYTNKIKEELKEERADEDTINKVYTLFTEICELSDKHKKYLLEERKLNEDRLNDYFTFPTRKVMSKLEKKIEEENLSLDILKNVPGFYYDEKKQKYSFVSYKGIGIKIRNTEGKIVGIQIRRDNIEEKQSRYIWFSSAFMNYKEGYNYGASPGSPVDVVFPKKITNPIIAITEGRFKAEKLAEVGFITISVQGVTNWKSIINEIKNILNKDEYKVVYEKYVKKYHKKPYIYVCFDSDIIYNYNVFTQAQKMTDKILEEYKEVFEDINYIHWNPKKGKGIDDLMINNVNYKEELKKFSKYTFEKIYNTVLTLLMQNEKIEDFRKVDSSLFKKYFIEYTNLCS